MKKSLESDYELNNRDDDVSQHSKSLVGGYGRKSKASLSQFSKANTNQIEQNLAFIENQVNQGSQPYQRSNTKSPVAQEYRPSGPPLSPSAGSGRVNVGQAQNSNAMNQSSEKSFFKNQSMNKTGMSGAPNPKMTGSSFYNATMAKTKI